MDKDRTPDLADPASYRYFAQDHVRFSDLDPVGHVNNNAIGMYLETGRIGFHDEAGVAILAPDGQPVLRRMETDFLAELHRPATLRVGVGLLGLGTTSWTLGCGVFHGERCVATARAVLVLIDRATRKPTPLPEPLRARYLDYRF